VYSGIVYQVVPFHVDDMQRDLVIWGSHAEELEARVLGAIFSFGRFRDTDVFGRVHEGKRAPDLGISVSLSQRIMTELSTTLTGDMYPRVSSTMASPCLTSREHERTWSTSSSTDFRSRAHWLADRNNISFDCHK